MPDISVQELAEAIYPLDQDAIAAARDRDSRLTKPAGSLGRLEALALQVSGIMGRERPRVNNKAVILAAGDHGVVAQGVTAYPQRVTAQMVRNILGGGAAISVMAKHANVRIVVVDAGVAADDLPNHPSLRRLAFGKGTADMTRGPAMSRSDAERCLIEGAYIAQLISRQGVDVIGTGEMGIGNSTAAAAVVSALTGEPPEKTTGRGTGRTDAELEGKVAVVRAALEKNHPTAKDPVDVLAKVGGYEIGVLAGAILGASEARRPIVLDGFISGAAALVAAAICPIAKQFMIAGHLSPEPGHAITLKHLGLSPLLDLNMRLGEGTGAILAMQVVEAAAACLGEMATFEQAGVTDKG